jgi:uncharacterized protein YciI
MSDANTPREFLCILRPARPQMVDHATDREKQIVGEHFEYLKRLCDEGTAVIVGRTIGEGERTIGIWIMRARDEAHARELAEGDPCIVHNVMTAEVRPFSIALHHTCKPQSVH